MHGGLAPQVLASAGERINQLAPRAVDVMEELMGPEQPPVVRLGASRDILDRAGYKATEKIQQDGRTVIEIEYVARTLELPEP